MSGWRSFSEDELARASWCNCEFCRLITGEEVASSDDVGRLRDHVEVVRPDGPELATPRRPPPPV